MRPYKRFVVFGALAAIVFVGSTATSKAQSAADHDDSADEASAGTDTYAPYYYDPYFFADPWFGYQYQYPMRPYGYGYGYRTYGPEASVRLEVKPKEAGVYVDGYYAGIVDDFDGTFQRLRVKPGEHEVELYMDGYRTMKQQVYLTQDNTFRIRYTMERLGSGEPPSPKPQPVDPPQGGNQPQPPPQQQPPDNRRGGQGASAYGTLAVKVQPGDAEISIDGENWRGSGGQDRLAVEVAEGSHTVEIRKAGYHTYVTHVDIRRGQTTPLNVSLRGGR